jgi:hypothetical protein
MSRRTVVSHMRIIEDIFRPYRFRPSVFRFSVTRQRQSEGKPSHELSQLEEDEVAFGVVEARRSGRGCGTTETI